jgi:bifunctional non-homologous end joining protein LigD
MWMTNQNCITPHVWTRRVPDIYHPDVCVFDLDPLSDDANAVRAAALALRDYLNELQLPTLVKTSGSKGFHIVVPLDGRSDLNDAWGFAEAVAREMIARHPDLLTLEFHKVDRGGRILLDTGRNGYSATFAAAYAVRPKPGAPVSAPCTWEEIERGDVHPQSFTLRGMHRRIEAVGDLWADITARGVSLAAAIAQLQAQR